MLTSLYGDRSSTVGARCAAIAVAGALLGACGGDRAEPTAVGDGGAGDGQVGACDMRCAAAESPEKDACGCTTDGVRMRLSSLTEGFFSQPWPLATRLRADDTLDLNGFPAPLGALFVTLNIGTIADQTRGFSTNGAIFMSFDGAIDPTSLPPNPRASLDGGASAYLVDVGDESTRGERAPIGCSYREGMTAYNPEHFLACAPVPGFPLRPSTRYALVLTDKLIDASGAAVRPSQRLLDVLHGRQSEHDQLASELAVAFAPLVEWLKQEDALDRVVGATVFETQDPTAGMRALAEHVQSLEPPAATDLAEYEGELPEESGNYTALQGTYDTPIYQQGETPYALAGGNIVFGDDGKPVQNGTLSLRFGLTLPKGTMPKGGWPVVLYHHGSGGDAYSFISDGTAYHLAEAGVAAIGIDAPVHGTRKAEGDDASTLFFNVANVLALRDNIRQGAADLLALERFVEAFRVEAEDSPTDAEIRFDVDRVFAMGHSQGGLTVPLMLPFAKHVKGAMLSGAGASITASIIYKHEPIDIPSLARTFLGLAEGDALDEFHPALALVQAFSDVSDALNYAPYLYRWPGGRGMDVWATQGLLDTYAPKPVTDALVTAIGLQPLSPLPQSVPGLTLRGVKPAAAPLSQNVEGVDGERYTGAYSQYENDDHFLIMQDPDAEAQLTHWFATLAKDGHGELIAP
jgi:predicted esterase